MVTYIPTSTSVRSAKKSDRFQLSHLLQFEPYIHRHLDWTPPLDLIGASPFLVAETNGRLAAALACPPDPPHVAWLRVFASSRTIGLREAWDLLWPAAHNYLSAQPDIQIASICLDSWFRRLLEENDFQHTHNVVLLTWNRSTQPTTASQSYGNIREMTFADLGAVHQIDNLAFKSLWQNSLSTNTIAFQQSVISTVIEDEMGIAGYQISTPNPLGGHLARLAVHPRAQGRGHGYTLVCDVIERFKQRGALRITVNTQHNNYASLALYKKATFTGTGEEYPVFQR